MPPQKLPIFKTVGEAWRSTFAAVRAMPVLSLISAVLLAVLAAVQIGVSRDLLNPASSLDADALGSKVRLLNFVIGIVQAVLLAPFAIAVHRFILLGETARRYALDVTSVRYRRFVAFAVVLNIFWYLPETIEALGLLGDGLYGSFGWFALTIAVFAAAIVILVRLSVMLPAAAIDASDSDWTNAWRLTQGSFWRMFFAFVFAVAPVTLLASVLTVLIVGTVSAFGIVALVLFAIIWAGGLLLVTAAGIAVLSHIYSSLRSRPVLPPAH